VSKTYRGSCHRVKNTPQLFSTKKKELVPGANQEKGEKELLVGKSQRGEGEG